MGVAPLLLCGSFARLLMLMVTSLVHLFLGFGFADQGLNPCTREGLLSVRIALVEQPVEPVFEVHASGRQS